MFGMKIGDYETIQHVSIIYLLIYLLNDFKHVQFFYLILTDDWNKYW